MESYLINFSYFELPPSKRTKSDINNRYQGSILGDITYIYVINIILTFTSIFYKW